MTNSMPNWDDLRIFLAVAEAGSFSKAAKQVRQTQPTISRRIDALEQDMGAKLFRRESDGVHLTDAGRQIVEKARQMSRTVDQIATKTQNVDMRPEGRIGLSAPDGLAAFWLVPHMREFMQAYPKLHIALDCGMGAEDPNELTSDIAIQYSEPTHPDALRIPLCHVHYAMFAAPLYAQTYGLPATIQEAMSHKILTHTEQRMQKNRWADKMVAARDLINPDLLTNSSAAVMFGVMNGIGIAALPTTVRDICPELIPLEIGRVASLRLWMVYDQSTARSAKVIAVKSWLESIFNPARSIWLAEDFVDPRNHPPKPLDVAGGYAFSVQRAQAG